MNHTIKTPMNLVLCSYCGWKEETCLSEGGNRSLVQQTSNSNSFATDFSSRCEFWCVHEQVKGWDLCVNVIRKGAIWALTVRQHNECLFRSFYAFSWNRRKEYDVLLQQTFILFPCMFIIERQDYSKVNILSSSRFLSFPNETM